MQTAAAKLIDMLSPSGITGPIFDKELRVSSRRKRTYYLRMAYIIMLMLLVTVSWMSYVVGKNPGSAIYQASRMAEVGRSIIMSMTWFQFIAAQILAVIMLSNAISSEIHHKTLDVLMTTPITCFQIVVGKLASAIVQLVLLLSISFTVLGILRVFGGIQWDYVFSTFCVTITGCIFAASLSLFFSIKAKQPYSVIVTVMIIYIVSIGVLSLFNWFSGSSASSIFSMLHPFMAFFALQLKAMPAAGSMGATIFFWPAHCMTMLSISAVIIALSVVMVRKSALRQLAPATAKKKGKTKIHKRSASAVEMKYMVGAPIIQGKLYISKRTMILKILGFTALLIAVVICSLSMFFGNRMFFLHTYVSIGLWFIATIRTGSMAAASIAREKESRSLTLLLTTPLTSRQIIKAKSKAALRRNLPLWLLIIISNILFYIGIMASNFGRVGGGFGQLESFIIQIVIIVIHIPVYMYFLTASGLYFGARLKNQSSAVIGFVIFALSVYILYYIFVRFVVMFFISALGGFSSSFGGLLFTIINSAVPIVIYLITGIILKRKTVKNLRKYAF